MLKKTFCLVLSFLFISQSTFINNPVAFAETPFTLPLAGQMISLSQPFNPVMINGLRYDPQKPFQFQFIIQQADKAIPLDQLRDEGMQLVRYFMAAMAMPAEDLWVNLSPYEKEHIIPQELSLTRLGGQMLAQDYLLKELSSSLTFPDSKTGSEFWQKIYKEAETQLGRTDVPVSTFNKVWIVPEYAEVFVRNNAVVITKSHLKVMMEQDYIARKKTSVIYKGPNLASDVMRQVIIPILEKEVNTGAHFAPLRQMFHAVILAEWYKRNLKNSIINRFYANQHKVSGIDELDTKTKENIYKQYLSAYKKGVYNFIREDAVPDSTNIVARKYFSGGENFANAAMVTHETTDPTQLSDSQNRTSYLISVGLNTPLFNQAMLGQDILTMDHGIIPQSDVSLTTGDGIKFLKEMQDRWGLPPNAPSEMQQLVDELKYHNKSIWFRSIKVPTPFGPQWLLMNRVRHYGDTTGGGTRYITETDIGNSFPSRNILMRKFIQILIALAQGMTQKNTAAVGLGIGGAKGGYAWVSEGENGEWSLTKWPKDKFQMLNTLAAYWYGYWYTKDGWKGADEDRLAADMYTGEDQMAAITEGRLDALLEKRNEKVFEWRDSYLRLLQEKNRNGFIPPKPGSYKELYEFLTKVKEEKDRHPTEYTANTPLDTPLLRAYFLYAQEHPDLPMPELSAVAGKPLNLGGMERRKSATGDGIIHVINEYFRLKGESHVGKTISVQGFGGNVATYTTLLAADNGYTVKAVNNLGATLDSSAGLSKKWLLQLLKLMSQSSLPDIIKTNPEFFTSNNVEVETQDHLFTIPADVFVSAASQNAVTANNVHYIVKDVHCEVYVEGGNDTADTFAQEVLNENNIDVIPDSIANAGGSITSTVADAQWWILGLRSSKIRLSDKTLKDDMDKLLTSAMERFTNLQREKNKSITKQSQRVTLRDELMWYIIRKLDMQKLIIEHHGEINAIRLYHYPIGTGISADFILKRIVGLGLKDELRTAQRQNLEKIRHDIVNILEQKFPNCSRDELIDLVGRMFVLPPNSRITFGDTLATARAFLHLLQGESLSEAGKRLAGVGPGSESEGGIPYALQLRKSIVPVLEAAHAPPPVAAEIINDITRLSEVSHYNQAMVTDGGIDFDASHMLIDEEGEAAFQTQIMPSNLNGWQQIKGLRPIFLKLQPVSIPALMGIK